MTATPPAARGRPKGSFTQYHRLEVLRELLLQRPRGMTLEEIAESLDVTIRSARRYMQQLGREFDLEKVSSKSRAPLWRLRPQDRPRKVALRPTQAYAFLAARRLFDLLRGSTLFDDIDLAVKALLNATIRPGRAPGQSPPNARFEERFVFLPAAPFDYQLHAEELEVLYQAVAELHPVSCHYRDPQGKELAAVLHPYAMVLYDDAIFVIGKLLALNEIRIIPLEDLLNTVLLSEDQFELPPDFDLQNYHHGPFGLHHPGRKVKVVIDFDPALGQKLRLRRIHPSQRFSTQKNGEVRLTLSLTDSSHVLKWVLGFGAAARIIEPETLRDRAKAELERALSFYRG